MNYEMRLSIQHSTFSIQHSAPRPQTQRQAEKSGKTQSGVCVSAAMGYI